MGPYVKAGLDQARRDMEFCFREAERVAAQASAGAARRDPTVFRLYLVAREGAIDVVDVGLEHRGDATPELAACCAEVLRGLEIAAFRAEPGRRWRLAWQLP
jgi:hypothetical protein